MGFPPGKPLNFFSPKGHLDLRRLFPQCPLAPFGRASLPKGSTGCLMEGSGFPLKVPGADRSLWVLNRQKMKLGYPCPLQIPDLFLRHVFLNTDGVSIVNTDPFLTFLEGRPIIAPRNRLSRGFWGARKSQDPAGCFPFGDSKKNLRSREWTFG